MVAPRPSSQESTAPPPWRIADRPYVLLVLAALFWSGNFIIGRAVHEAVPPIGLAFWRWAVASLIILAAAYPHLVRDWPALRAGWRNIVLLAVLGVTAYNTLVYVGLQTTSAINSLLMQSTMPVVIILMTFLLFGERFTLLQATGVLVSLGGAVTIVSKGDWVALLRLSFNVGDIWVMGAVASYAAYSALLRRRLSFNVGDIWVMGAVASYAAYSALLRRRPSVHPLSLLAATFITGTIALAPFYGWETLVVRAMPGDLATVGAVAYLAVFPSVLAFFCYNRGVQAVGANRAGVFIHLVPVFGIFMAVAFLGEELSLTHLLGMGLIFTGIAIAARRTKAT